MIRKLSNSPKFLREKELFRLKLDLIDNEKAKSKIEKLIKDLEKQIQLIDSSHSIYNPGEIRPSLLEEARRSATLIRREIYKKLDLELKER